MLLVERLSQSAAVAPWNDSVDAHKEELAVVGIRVTWVSQAEGLVHHRALEVEHVFGHAALLLGLIGPRTNASLGAEDEPRWTRDHIEFTLDAVEELVADSLLGMSKVSVLARTVHCGLGRL